MTSSAAHATPAPAINTAMTVAAKHEPSGGVFMIPSSVQGPLEPSGQRLAIARPSGPSTSRLRVFVARLRTGPTHVVQLRSIGVAGVSAAPDQYDQGRGRSKST